MKLDFESNTMTLRPVVENNVSTTNETANNSFNTSKMLRNGIEAAQSGKSSEARNLLLRVTESEPGNEKAWLWLASISEYPEELLVFLNNVLKINPENERAIEWAKATKSLLSKTFVQRGIDASGEQVEFAKQCFSQAIGHDENNEMAWLWMASVSDSEEEKAHHLQKVLSINPENETAKGLLNSMQKQKCEAIFEDAQTFAAEGANAEALDALETYFGQSAANENAWMLKAFLVNSFAEKMDCFVQVLEINPENLLARNNADYLRSMLEKTSVQEFASEISQTEEIKEENDFAIQSAEESAKESDFTMQAVEEEFSSEAMPSDEFHATSEENVAEDVIPEFTTYQDYSHEEAQAEYDEMELKFDELQSENDTPQTLEFEDSPAPEDPVYQSEEVEFEMPTENSFESHEKGYGFYQEEAKEEEKVEETIVEQPAPHSLFDVPQNNSFVDYESKTETYNLPELTQDYAFNQPAAESDYESKPAEVYINQENEAATAENNYSHLFETQEDETPTMISSEVQDELPETSFEAAEEGFESVEVSTTPQIEMMTCVFCNATNDAHALMCFSCRACLTLADLEMILTNQEADKEIIGNAVSELEAARENRALNADELKQIALGYLNVGNLSRGLQYLTEAVKSNPDDFVLSGQINSLKIRQADIEKQNAAQEGMPKNLTILVVDDSATVRKLISGKLEKTGHAVVSAIDGIDALEKIKDMVPDLVLLDINMPRMDGYQVCKMIRSNDATKDVPVVMISGKDGFFDKVRGRMAGTTGYITKPFGPETLMKTVETYIV
ncbi:MAG TPA: response regulator [Pyrinomonadaceae bacterium]|nr:response regulator [Pyrinomonadaceae bacterium]